MGRSVRLIRVIDRLNVGGPTHHVSLLTRDLDRRGYRTTLVSGQVAPGEVEMTDVIVRSGVKPLEIRGLSRSISPFQDLRVLMALYRLFRRTRPHIVHTHKSKAGVLGRVAAWMAGVPVTVHTFHGHPFKGYFSRWKTGVILLVERLLGHWSDAVVAVSRQQRSELLAYRISSASRLHAIPLGLELDPYLAGSGADDGFRAELGFPPGALLIGMVTRLVPIKGIEVFLNAARKVVKEIPQVRFVIVGDGELRTELEILARRLGLEDSVRFTGYRRDTVRIYKALDLVALSSFNEGLPVTLIEAISSGCYVVATRAGGVPDLVESDRMGLVVAPGDSEALAAAMVRALREGRRAHREERNRMEALYGIRRLTEDLDLLYRFLLKRRNRG